MESQGLLVQFSIVMSGILLYLVIFDTINKGAFTGRVIAYPVMREQASLALKDNLEVGEAVLDICSISCVCTSTF